MHTNSSREEKWETGLFGEEERCRPLEIHWGEAQELGHFLFFSFLLVFPPDNVILEAIFYNCSSFI